ncbi:MAG: DMT family transporter [Alphaproteobacteria bacterium]|nr:DMT family transporter [Alphaproteobacteria bacterium]
MASDHLRGVALVAAGALCWSSGGILVRMVDASGLAIVFWRSVFMLLAVGAFLVARNGFGGTIAMVRAMGRTGIASGVLLTGAFVGYILSLKFTTVANTVVIMSASPLVAALLARLVLGEPLPRRTVIAIGVAFAGIAVMFSGSLAGGGWIGNLLALMVAVSFGANIVAVRRGRALDMVPATFLGGVISAALVGPFAEPWLVSATDLGWLALMGGFQLGLGLFLFTRGTRHLRAAEVGLLTLLETVLAPLWVWIGVGEEPGALALIGGAMVMAALAGQALAPGSALPPMRRPEAG